MAAHAIAKELKHLYYCGLCQLESKYVGETSKNITEIFRKAKENKLLYFLMKLMRF
jgi:SpoVK/Ycf46/Vps4 family AAA+-type ATPase